MDKLTRALNKPDKGVAALRIVAAEPVEDVSHLTYSLIVLDNLDEGAIDTYNNLHPLQQKMVNFILSFEAKHKILYIGSRIDNYRKDKTRGFSISVGSGALVTEDVILALKARGVKIVVCCLELIFHTRSLHHSFRLYETLRHHLQHADLLHFLTEKDKEYGEQTIPERLAAGNKLVHPDYPLEETENSLFNHGSRKKKSKPSIQELQRFINLYFKNKEDYQQYFEFFHQKDFIERLRSIPGIYAPGICTIAPLDFKLISVDFLMKRPRNVLVFSLIRSHKGIEEGLALGRLFFERKLESQVYIVGKILSINCIYKQIFIDVFDETSILEHGINIHERMRDCVNSTDLNQAFQALFNELVAIGVKKKANVILKLNASESELIQIGFSCRYALKLDGKGYAENASSMISCLLGLGLPVICQRGIVSPKDSDYYSPALHLLDSSLKLQRDEIRPEPVNLEDIINIIHESNLAYELRLRVLLNMAQLKLFNVEHDASILMHHLVVGIFNINQENPYSFFSGSKKLFKDKKPDSVPAPLPYKEPCQL